MAESEEKLKSRLMNVKEESAKAFLLKLTNVMSSVPMNPLQIDGEEVEVVTDLIFLGSKISADGDCSYEIKRRLLFGRKAMADLHKILKDRDVTLPTKIRIVSAMVFPVVTYSCESWTINKAMHRNIYAFELWIWRKLLRVPWTARRPNKSILKEISPDYSLEGLLQRLKLKYFGHIMRRSESLENSLMLGKIEGKRRRGHRRLRWIDNIYETMNMPMQQLKDSVTERHICCAKVHMI